MKEIFCVLNSQKALLKQASESCDFDPRALIEEDKVVFVRADKFFSNEVIQEDDTIIRSSECLNRLRKILDTTPLFVMMILMNNIMPLLMFDNILSLWSMRPYIKIKGVCYEKQP